MVKKNVWRTGETDHYYRVRGKWGVTQYTHTYISCNDSVGGDASVDCGKEEYLEENR